MNLRVFSIISVIFFTRNYVMAAECPTPRHSVDPKIEVQVDHNKKTNEYTYSYLLSNGASAKLNLFMLIVESPANVEGVSLPKNWNLKDMPVQEPDPRAFQFSSIVEEISPMGKPVKFVIKSINPPGLTKYYVDGSPEFSGPNSTVIKAVPSEDDEGVAPDCPGLYMDDTSFFNKFKTGITVGPVNQNQIDVELKMKVQKINKPHGWDDECDKPELNITDEGKVEVILSSRELDVEKIDLTSIRFGPGEAVPKASRIISKDRKKIGHWKKAPRDPKLLFMEFDISDLKIRCDLDSSLRLKASAEEKSLVGSVRITNLGCSKKVWDGQKKKFNRK